MEKQPSLVTMSCLVVTIVFTLLATGAVGLRLLTSRESKTSRIDDYLIIGSLVGTIVLDLKGFRNVNTFQIFCYGTMIQTICAGAVGGINTTTLPPMEAASYFLKVCRLLGEAMRYLVRSNDRSDRLDRSVSPCSRQRPREAINPAVLQNYLRNPAFSPGMSHSNGNCGGLGCSLDTGGQNAFLKRVASIY